MTVDVVVKVGGGVLDDLDAFRAVVAAVSEAGRRARVLVVPGGGPFADAVRELDARLPLSDDVAHWAAVLGMEQYALLLASAIDGARLVATPDEVSDALAARALPVLAPYQWLREADPLPHSWDVTSDSIAAWVAGQLGAPHVVLVKPAGAVGSAPDVVDPYFDQALAQVTEVTILAAEDAAWLPDVLGDASGRPVNPA